MKKLFIIPLSIVLISAACKKKSDADAAPVAKTTTTASSEVTATINGSTSFASVPYNAATYQFGIIRMAGTLGGKRDWSFQAITKTSGTDGLQLDFYFNKSHFSLGTFAIDQTLPNDSGRVVVVYYPGTGKAYQSISGSINITKLDTLPNGQIGNCSATFSLTTSKKNTSNTDSVTTPYIITNGVIQVVAASAK